MSSWLNRLLWASCTTCVKNSQCVVRSLGGPGRCVCKPGFEGDGRVACLPVDMCLTHSCGLHEVCTSLAGAARCDCSSGFRRDPASGLCWPHDGCKSSNGHSVCSRRGMVCEHQPALLWAAEHQHWTEHHHHSAGHGSGAKQHQGPDKHHQKPVEHYQGPGEHSSAGDGLVVASHGLVHEHFRCRCPRSLPVFDQDTLQCRRHDACLDANPCDPTTSFCVSSDEGATADCLCHQGFEWDERRGQCVDVDECARGTHKCPALISTCVNSPGGYECECSRLYGFANQLPVHNRACVNFNECVEIPHVCGHLPCCKDLQPSTNPILPHSGYECSDFDNFVSDQPPEEIIVSAKDLPPPFGLPPFGLPSFGLPEPWPAPSSGNLGSLYGGLPSYSELPSYVGAPSYVGLPAQESFTYRDVYHDDGYSDPAYSHVSVPRQVEPYQDEPYKVEPYQVEPHLGEGYKVAGRRLGVSSLLVGRGPLPKFNVSSVPTFLNSLIDVIILPRQSDRRRLSGVTCPVGYRWQEETSEN